MGVRPVRCRCALQTHFLPVSLPTPAFEERSVTTLVLLACIALTETTQEAVPDEQIQHVLDKWDPSYGSVLAISATVRTERVTIVEPSPPLELLTSSLLDVPARSVGDSAHTILHELMGSQEIAHPVYYLRQRIELDTDDHRTRCHTITVLPNGGQVESTAVNSGEYQIEYDPADDGSSGTAVIDRADSGVSLLSISDLFPRDIPHFVRIARNSGTVTLQTGRDISTLSFTISEHNIIGTVDYGDDLRIFRTRLEYPGYVELRSYGRHAISDGVAVPRSVLLVHARRDSHGKWVSGHAQSYVVDDIVINPTLTDSDFQMPLPAGVTVQRFEGATEVDRGRTSQPVDDVAAFARDLSALPRNSDSAAALLRSQDASATTYRWPLVALNVLILVMLIVFIRLRAN